MFKFSSSLIWTVYIKLNKSIHSCSYYSIRSFIHIMFRSSWQIAVKNRIFIKAKAPCSNILTYILILPSRGVALIYWSLYVATMTITMSCHPFRNIILQIRSTQWVYRQNIQHMFESNNSLELLHCAVHRKCIMSDGTMCRFKLLHVFGRPIGWCFAYSYVNISPSCPFNQKLFRKAHLYIK